MPNQEPFQTVDDTLVLLPEPCPPPTIFTVDGCKDTVHTVLPALTLPSLGRVVQVDVTLKQICPGKQVAVTVLLMELDADGTETPRGAKHLLVPAFTGDTCRDVLLRCIPFSVPEALDPQGSASICNARRFSTRVLANYADTDFACCDSQAVIV